MDFFGLLKLSEEERNRIFNSGIFNDIVESYLVKVLYDHNIKLDLDDVHEHLKSLFDCYDAKDILLIRKDIIVRAKTK